MYAKPYLVGAASYIPGLKNLISRKTASASPRYCYSLWMRHLVMAAKNGLPTQFDVIAELGPGGSLGTGLAGLLSGASKYYALDVKAFADMRHNMDIFDELVKLFTRREKIPGKQEFPRAKPHLESDEFPSHILTDERMSIALAPERISAIKYALMNLGQATNNGIQISYYAPWNDPQVIQDGTVDMIFSQAVCEHVDDLPETYEALYRWLKPNGFMSHQIDYKSHGTAKTWYGHWTHSDFAWKLIRGNRIYLLNRQPHSVHIKLLQRYGFQVVYEGKVKESQGVRRMDLAKPFRDMTDDDLSTSGAFIQVTKRAGAKT